MKNIKKIISNASERIAFISIIAITVITQIILARNRPHLKMIMEKVFDNVIHEYFLK